MRLEEIRGGADERVPPASANPNGGEGGGIKAEEEGERKRTRAVEGADAPGTRKKKRKEYRPSGFSGHDDEGQGEGRPGGHEWSGLKVRRTSARPIAVVES